MQREFTHATQMHLLANTNKPDSVQLLGGLVEVCMAKGKASDISSQVTDLAWHFSKHIWSCKYRK